MLDKLSNPISSNLYQSNESGNSETATAFPQDFTGAGVSTFTPSTGERDYNPLFTIDLFGN